jgi:hypothetical protein
MTSKRSKGGTERPPSRTKPKAGFAGQGETVDPTTVGKDDDKPRAAPAPGLPMSQDAYERLKREAQTRPVPRSKDAQEDPSGKP